MLKYLYITLLILISLIGFTAIVYYKGKADCLNQVEKQKAQDYINAQSKMKKAQQKVPQDKKVFIEDLKTGKQRLYKGI